MGRPGKEVVVEDNNVDQPPYQFDVNEDVAGSISMNPSYDFLTDAGYLDGRDDSFHAFSEGDYVDDDVSDDYTYPEGFNLDDVGSDEEQESTDMHDSDEFCLSPGGTKYWVPDVPDAYKVEVGMKFDSLEEAEGCYIRYAECAGFDVRRTNRKTNKYGDVQTRFMVCSKEGAPPSKDFDSMTLQQGERKSRNSNVKRQGCNARCRFHLTKDRKQYEIYHFVDRHNHPLLNSVDKRLLRVNRQLKYTDYVKVIRGASANIGSSTLHKMEAYLKGGYQYLGATKVDYQNARRDVVSFVGHKDAKMFVNLLEKRRVTVPEFFVEYKCVKKELACIFWADEICRLNYKEFGDSISIDGTYRTNVHAMIFCPFTAIDNHKKSVIVGSALMWNEKVPTYEWVLSAFLKCHGKQPLFVMTDQCPSLKQAIPAIFPQSNHRLCMWHIMKNMRGRVRADLKENTTFQKKIHKLVWNVNIDTSVFESRWHALVEEFQLQSNGWMRDMFAVRESWIPAYYKSHQMSGLLRTTSRSESVNSYMHCFLKWSHNLVKFIAAYDDALSKQRDQHRALEYVTRNTLPNCLTPLPLERHATEVFTRTVFFELQKEMRKAFLWCGLRLLPPVNGCIRYLVLHKNKKSETKYTFEVVQEQDSSDLRCGCNKFIRDGILCRHMLKVLMNDDVMTIPDRYILRRWTRSLVPVELQAARARYGEVDSERDATINNLYNQLDIIVSRSRDDKKKLALCEQVLDDLKLKVGATNLAFPSAKDKADAFRDCYGIEDPEEVDIFAPTGICNKGCGKGKRLKGTSEKVADKCSRPKRLCRTCGEHANHDSRNCPKR